MRLSSNEVESQNHCTQLTLKLPPLTLSSGSVPARKSLYSCMVVLLLCLLKFIHSYIEFFPTYHTTILYYDAHQSRLALKFHIIVIDDICKTKIWCKLHAKTQVRILKFY